MAVTASTYHAHHVLKPTHPHLTCVASCPLFVGHKPTLIILITHTHVFAIVCVLMYVWVLVTYTQQSTSMSDHPCIAYDDVLVTNQHTLKHTHNA